MIDEVYNAVEDEGAFRRLPRLLSSELGGRSCVMMKWNAWGELETLHSDRFGEDFVVRYKQARLGDRDIWRSALMRQPPLRACDLDLDVHSEDFARSVLKRELFDRLGDDTGRCLAVRIPTARGDWGVGVQRAASAPPFDREAVARLQALAGPLARMLRLRERLATDGPGLAAEALDRMPQAVLNVAADGVLRYANRPARELLQRGDGLASHRGRLKTGDAEAAARLAVALDGAARRPPGGSDALLVPRPSGRRAFRVIVAPDGIAEAGGALVMIDDPDAPSPPVGAAVRRLFGLTAAEAELARLLIAGSTPQEAAAARNVRIATVRTQIKGILTKTGARRVPEAVCLLSGLSRIAPADAP